MTGAENGSEALSADTDSVQIIKGGEVGEDELAALVAGIVAASAANEVDTERDAADFGSTRWVQGSRRRSSFPRNGRDAWRWSLR